MIDSMKNKRTKFIFKCYSPNNQDGIEEDGAEGKKSGKVTDYWISFAFTQVC